jgi:hypothetical protein
VVVIEVMVAQSSIVPAQHVRFSKESRFRMRCGYKLTTPVFLCCAVFASPSHAQDADKKADDADSKTAVALDPMLSLDPSAPQVAALPGGLTPSYGQPSSGAGDWRFDFHGFLSMPLRAGFNTRVDRRPGQSGTVVHSPPVVPDDLVTFSHTGVVPTAYAQLNFSYGNSVITANASILAMQPNVSTSFYDPPTQPGINDAFLHLHPKLGKNMRLQMYVGAFSNRYGIMGEHDLGRYGTPLIARTNGVGENVIATFGLTKKLSAQVEQGIQGQSNKAAPDLVPDGWNAWANSNAGSSFVNHVHAGLNYDRLVTLGGHFMQAWEQDDFATGTLAPDGKIRVIAADARATLGRFGHFYVASSWVTARYAGTVGRVIEVLNTQGGGGLVGPNQGGQGLIDNYFGNNSNGNGSLAIYGAQYDLSIGRLVSYPTPFSGDGPDIYVSAFGILTKVNSDDKRTDATGAKMYDGVTKYKYGIEASYSMLSWFAFSTRYDHVTPNVDNERYSFAVISPRLIFRTDWQSTDQLVLQYSHWMNGSQTLVRTGYPPREDPIANPDTDMLSLTASMWW